MPEPAHFDWSPFYTELAHTLLDYKKYHMSSNRIGIRTLDLNCEFSGVREQLDEIAEKYLLNK